MSPFPRILFVVIACGLMVGFGLAISLEPAARGYGTHQQLGLPPCSIQFLFGIPCPSCGMTTSFSWFVRGNLWASAQANLAGTYLAIVCLLLIPWLMVRSVQGTIPHTLILQHRAITLLVAFIVIAVCQWWGRFAFAS